MIKLLALGCFSLTLAFFLQNPGIFNSYCFGLASMNLLYAFNLPIENH